MPGIPGEQKIQIRWMHQGTEGERVVRSMDVYPFFFIHSAREDSDLNNPQIVGGEMNRAFYFDEICDIFRTGMSESSKWDSSSLQCSKAELHFWKTYRKNRSERRKACLKHTGFG